MVLNKYINNFLLVILIIIVNYIVTFGNIVNILKSDLIRIQLYIIACGFPRQNLKFYYIF